MANVLSAIEGRRARRALSAEPIGREDVETLLAAAHVAPSCNNSQPWRFVVADDPETLAKVKEALSGGNYWAKEAPVIVAVTSRRDLDCTLSDARDYFLFGCGMAVGNLMAQATSMGLVAHPIAGYKPEVVKASLGIPETYVVIALVIVGRPGDVGRLSDKHRERELGPRERRPLEDVVAWNWFSFEDPPLP
jgi:nitroreductase